MQPGHALNTLERLKLTFGGQVAIEKRGCLAWVARARLGSRSAVLRLHEQLCFMRAYPDDPILLREVVRLLRGFAKRSDFRRWRATFADSGIAGTGIHYRFYWPTARRLSANGLGLRIDWEAHDDPDRLASGLPLLVAPIAAAWLRAHAPDPQVAIARLKRRDETDADFLIRSVGRMPGDEFTREAYFDALDTPMRIDAGGAAFSRTLARHAASPTHYFAGPLRRDTPELRAELTRAPKRLRLASPGEGARLIDLALGAIVTRQRDIDGITYGNPADVWVADDSMLPGLQWAFIGLVPERRQVLRASHGFVTLRNGVPIGYGQFDTLFRCADVSFNSFDSFRGAETGWIFARLLAAVHALLGATAFTLDGYQLGHHNEEAIASGAWWFYWKLGFRPRDPAILRLAQRELASRQKNPARRSSPATLRRLAAGVMAFETGAGRAIDWERLARVGENVRGATEADAAQAMRRLGVKPPELQIDSAQDLLRAWGRWAPVLQCLPVGRWSPAERRALAAVVSAKGGPSERDFLEGFDTHPRLSAALRRFTGA